MYKNDKHEMGDRQKVACQSALEVQAAKLVKKTSFSSVAKIAHNEHNSDLWLS